MKINPEKIFTLVKSQVSSCICHTCNFLKVQIPDICLNKLSNEYADKIIADIIKKLKEE